MNEKIRYTAKFTPQQWVNKCAVVVDPHGPDVWDCTKYMAGLPDDAARARAMEPDSYDSDDVRDDPNAPQWVRDWSGPFYVTVTDNEE